MARNVADNDLSSKQQQHVTAEALINENGGLFHSVDRIVCQVTDPDTAFRFFAETLGLPVQVPLNRSERMSSAMFLLGNVALEMLHYPNENVLPMEGSAGMLNMRILSGALRPSIPITQVPAALQRRGFPLMTSKVHEGPVPAGLRPYTAEEIVQSERPTIATTVTVHGVIQAQEDDASSAIQIIEHTHDVDRRREDESTALIRHHGGPLGLLGLHTLWAEVDNVERGLGRWLRFLHPAQPCGFGRWSFVSGPAFRVQQGVANRWGGLILRVDALEQAMSYLTSQGIGCDQHEGAAEVDPSATFGLRLTLTDQDWADPIRPRVSTGVSTGREATDPMLHGDGRPFAHRRFDA